MSYLSLFTFFMLQGSLRRRLLHLCTGGQAHTRAPTFIRPSIASHHTTPYLKPPHTNTHTPTFSRSPHQPLHKHTSTSIPPLLVLSTPNPPRRGVTKVDTIRPNHTLPHLVLPPVHALGLPQLLQLVQQLRLAGGRWWLVCGGVCFIQALRVSSTDHKQTNPSQSINEGRPTHTQPTLGVVGVGYFT